MANVLVVRASYRKAYPVMESLKRAGYRVIVGMDTMISEALFSIFADEYAWIVNPYRSEKLYVASIISAIKKNDVDMVVPVGFIDFLLLSKYKDVLERYAIIPVDNFEKIINLSNKWYISELAESVGIDYPRTLFLKGDVDDASIRAFLNDVGLPLVVKGFGDDSKPRFVSSLDDLNKEIKLRSKAGVLLQEFIVGVGAGYFVLSDNGKPIAEFMHRRIVEVNPLGGASIKAASNFDPELLSLGRKIVEKTKFNGVMMVEFKKEAETGKYYLMEINPKFWGSLELAYKAGVDFPRYLADFYLKGEKPKRTSIKNVSFSWITEAVTSYSKHGLNVLTEIIQRALPDSFLLSDLHPYDPPNFVAKLLFTASSILRASNKVTIESTYLTKCLKDLLYKRRLDLIISDLDGTLAKLNIPWRSVRSKAVETDLIKPYKGINESLVQYWLTGDEHSFTKLHDLMKDYEINAAINIRKNETLSRLLKTIKQKSIYFAVVSKQCEEAITKCLSKLGILDYVDLIVGRDVTPLRFKALTYVIEKMKINKPYRGIVFGDTLIDVKAALKVGLIPCRIATNYIERLQAIDLNISYTDNITKILKLIADTLR
jgi:phosphoglycolate phosphatase-like HAD superfamily hydrolase/glutathione synthase/RimK-type ligase-like ATP-grasp enzyme